MVGEFLKMHRFFILSVISHMLVGLNAGVVTFIAPCTHEDKECILREAQKSIPYLADGLPDLGVPAADPIVLEDVRADEGDLKLGFKDLTVVGPKHCKFESVEFTGEKSIAFTVFCPVTATGNYHIEGKLIGVPVEGAGPMEIKTNNVKISINADFDKKNRDGNDYWHITSVKQSYEPIDQVYIKLDNLFNGDKEKAKPIIDILNLSWKEILMSVGKPVIDELINKEINVIRKFFDAVPVNELVEH